MYRPLPQELTIKNSPIEGLGLFATKDITEQLQHNDQIVFRYCDSEGNATDSSNPNGSVSNIAGICNATRNVLGMMPHPERASELVLGGTDGSLLWGSLAEGL